MRFIIYSRGYLYIFLCCLLCMVSFFSCTLKVSLYNTSGRSEEVDESSSQTDLESDFKWGI